jgi:nucleoside-diphosphate-sugar epimerase
VKTSLSYLIDSLIEAYGKQNQVKVGEIGATPGDIMGCYADISKISEQLGYQPEYSLEKGIEHFKEWAKKES